MKERFLEAGEIVSTHGVRGEVKILPWADGPEFLTEFDVLYLGGKPMEGSAWAAGRRFRVGDSL